MIRIHCGSNRRGDRVVSFLGALLLSAVPTLVRGQSEVVEYYHLDAAGNVRAVTNEAGQVIERHDYLPFGKECTTGPCAANLALGVGQPREFTGKERDPETGLDYFGARYYAPKIGRFTTVDPVLDQSEAILDPQLWNRYAYGRNNPLRYVDPDGRATLAANSLQARMLAPPGPLPPGATGWQKALHAIALVGWALNPGGLMPAPTVMTIPEVAAANALSASTKAVQSGVQANRAAGDAWSKAVGTELAATHEVAVPEITVRTQSGVRTRLDWVTREGGGTLGCVECKASEAARLTANQAAAHPEIAETGAVVVGRGKPGVPGGTVIPPSQVQVVRPQ